MKQEKIMSFDEIQIHLDDYNDSLKDYDLSKTHTAKLKCLGWGKSANLMLLFSLDNIKFKTSVFHSNGYCSRDKSFCFRDLDLIDKNIELTLTLSKKGYLNIKSAKLKGEE